MPQSIPFTTRLQRSWPLLAILLFFSAFFWRVFFTGVHFVTGDALVYAMPMRAAAWEMIRHGELPLWTQTLLSGYPLLSMASLGLGYPLTWGYAFLPDYLAEEVYVLAPFLLSPMLMYAYLRGVGRSQCAALLGGLSFGYSGYMAGGLSHNGMLMNAVMWLPLFLLALERSRRDDTPWAALSLAALTYSLSVLTGLGQGFLWVAIIAGSYALCLSLSNVERAQEGATRSPLRRWRPLFVAAGAFALALGLGAFQILETMQFQRLSIRGKLSYEMFSGGAFDWRTLWQNFSAPLYHFNYEMTAYVAPLAVLLALVALAANLKQRNWRVWFWGVLALLGLFLMQGDGTPLYKWLYHVPAVNLFRVPWRHAYEWSLGLTMLAAFGWDALLNFALHNWPNRTGSVSDLRTHNATDTEAQVAHAPGSAFPAASLVVLAFTLIAALYVAYLALQPAPAGSATWTKLAESHWLWWKLLVTVGLALTLWLASRLTDSNWQTPLFIGLIFIACFWEQAILFHHWATFQHHPAAYYTQVSAATRFLQQQPKEAGRVYTSMGPGFVLDLPNQEPHNLSARRGLPNAAGYEPLMWKRYADVFGSGLNFATPNASAPFDRQTFTADWQALDLLNVRYLAEFGNPAGAATVERFGTRFSALDNFTELAPGASITLQSSAANTPTDTLTLVSALANAGDLAQGQPVAQLTFQFTDGTKLERELQAGVHTAEWAHERADVKANSKHALAPVFDSRPGDATNAFQAHRYWAKLNLPTDKISARVTVHNVTERASLLLSQALLHSSQSKAAQLLAQGLPDKWQPAATFPGAIIYQNPQAFPRAWLTQQAVSATPERALQCVRQANAPGCNLRQTTLLEAPVTALDRAQIPAQVPAASNNSEVKFEQYGNQQMTLRVKTAVPSVLVLSEISLPGWTATLDERPIEIYTANYLLRGVLVPAGEHRVEMRYASAAFRRGAWLTLLTLALLAGLAWLTWRTKHSTK